MDDIHLIVNNIPMLESLKGWLEKCFSMKDLEDAEYILGIKIYRYRSKRVIWLSQQTYIDNIATKLKMENSKRVFLPMQHDTLLSKTQCPSGIDEIKRMSNIPYAFAIGSIMNVVIYTLPNVSYDLSMCSRFQSNLGDAHWSATKNILKYLRKTKDNFLVYGGESELVVEGYTDASFQINKDDLRSQYGFIFCLNGVAMG